MRDGEAVVFPHKVPKRLLSLLKVLIALGGTSVAEDKLIDALWPDLDGDAAHQAFSVAVRRLRDLLGSPDAVKQQDGKLSLNPQQCWVDALVLERLLRQASAQNGCCVAAFHLYQGHFLPEDENERWSFNLRDRLHRDFMLLLNRSAQQLESANEWEAASRLIGKDWSAMAATEVLRHMENARKADSTSQSSVTPKAIQKKILDR